MSAAVPVVLEEEREKNQERQSPRKGGFFASLRLAQPTACECDMGNHHALPFAKDRQSHPVSGALLLDAK